MMSLHIKPVPVDEVLELRQRVLWPEKSLESVRVNGDAAAYHLAAFQDQIVVGVGSFYTDGAGARLRKLAVEPSCQGKGIGGQLVQTGAAHLRENGIEVLWCDARQTALAFYRGLGFTIDPEAFTKSGLPYHRATLSLT
ncbi:GNAT family N-acetyltransferase [Algirhabdus cladophorae]|uniref:GNAT family N-acetyltransferase n=1 Tax=Algirhabdus cladophorae TaxID=3377108 RepID=UPI003B84718B